MIHVDNCFHGLSVSDDVSSYWPTYETVRFSSAKIVLLYQEVFKLGTNYNRNLNRNKTNIH